MKDVISCLLTCVNKPICSTPNKTCQLDGAPNVTCQEVQQSAGTPGTIFQL